MPEIMEAIEMVKDPVCGHTTDPETAAATAEHDGVTYHFCAVSCRDSFVADPAVEAKAGA